MVRPPKGVESKFVIVDDGRTMVRPYNLTDLMDIEKMIRRMMLVVAVTAGGCVTEGDEPARSLAAGDRLPDFTVTMADGEVVSRTSLAGYPGVVVLFNTSCSDCREELPRVQETADECAEAMPDARFVCIAREEGAASVALYWHEHGLTLAYSPQPDRKVYEMFASSVIPQLYVFDRKGVITAVYADDALPSAADIVGAVRKAAATQP